MNTGQSWQRLLLLFAHLVRTLQALKTDDSQGSISVLLSGSAGFYEFARRLKLGKIHGAFIKRALRYTKGGAHNDHAAMLFRTFEI